MLSAVFCTKCTHQQTLHNLTSQLRILLNSIQQAGNIRSTYDVFHLESGVPTYGYELAQAVKDGYLVNFMSVETKLKFLE